MKDIKLEESSERGVQWEGDSGLRKDMQWEGGKKGGMYSWREVQKGGVQWDGGSEGGMCSGR